MAKEQSFPKTSFLKQAGVISSLIRTNPIMNDSDKASMQETVGVLHWLNQAQLKLATGSRELPLEIVEHIFGGRNPQQPVPQNVPITKNAQVIPPPAPATATT